MTEPIKYRNRPVVVEAMKWDGTEVSARPIVARLATQGRECEYNPFLADKHRNDPRVYVAHPDPFLRIKTPERIVVASSGDYIIRGVTGEFYRCKPEIFEQTYERVSDG